MFLSGDILSQYISDKYIKLILYYIEISTAKKYVSFLFLLFNEKQPHIFVAALY